MKHRYVPPGLLAVLLAWPAGAQVPAQILAQNQVQTQGRTQAQGHGRNECPVGQSVGSPRVELRHIFCGEINRRGLAVGFHSRPGGHNPPGVSGTPAPRPIPGHPGLYNLTRFQIAQDGQTGTKGISTMYPDKCSAADVVAAIQHAYNHGQRTEDQFRGPSGPSCTDADGKPFPIVGFTDRRGGVHIRTGYPDVGGGRP